MVSHPIPHDPQLVHELRKTIKRTRALARLLRPELGESRYAAADESLREAGHRLAAERDAQVRLTTLELLRKRHPKALEEPGIERLRGELEGRRRDSSSPAEDRELLRDIRVMRASLRSWSALDLDRERIASGLERIYRQGRRRYLRACRGRASSMELHDWRKRVKSLHYALEIVGARDRARQIAVAAKRLGDVLGQEHDLWMLAVYLEEHSQTRGSDETHKQLSRLIRRRRRKLRKRACKLGREVYEPSPSHFRDLL